MDDTNLIEEYELELWDIVDKMRKDGIRYEVIEWLFETTWRNLILKNQAGQYLEGRDLNQDGE